MHRVQWGGLEESCSCLGSQCHQANIFLALASTSLIRLASHSLFLVLKSRCLFAVVSAKNPHSFPDVRLTFSLALVCFGSLGPPRSRTTIFNSRTHCHRFLLSSSTNRKQQRPVLRRYALPLHFRVRSQAHPSSCQHSHLFQSHPLKPLALCKRDRHSHKQLYQLQANRLLRIHPWLSPVQDPVLTCYQHMYAPCLHRHLQAAQGRRKCGYDSSLYGL
jgi:hypothetical protein